MRQALLASVAMLLPMAAAAQNIAPITDAQGHKWTVTSGVIYRDGKKAAYSARVINLTDVNGTVWQENADKLWWKWTATGWGPYAGTSIDPTLSSASPPPVPPPAACNVPKDGGFGILDGVIYGPDQKPFIAAGVGVAHNGPYDPTAAEIQAAFPGTNFIRLAIYQYDSPDSLAAQIKDYTSHGMVVELEHHIGAGGGSPLPTGQGATAEANWYSAVASAFKNNPYVWYGTLNEPDTSNSSSAAASQLATYQAVRNTGNNAPIMLETNGGNPSDPATTGANGNDPAYQKMDNVIVDNHKYGWETNYNKDQSVNDAHVKASIAGIQANYKTGGGKVAVIIGEYGNSTDGVKVDPNGQQMVAAVGKSGVGTVAWLWGRTSGDGLNSGDGYGAQVAKTIAANATPLGPSGTIPASVTGCPVQPQSMLVQNTPAVDPASPATNPSDNGQPSTVQQQTVQVQQQIDAMQQQNDTDSIIAQANQRLMHIPSTR